MNLRLLTPSMLLFLTCLSYSQQEQRESQEMKKTDLGLSVQVYPAGIITTMHLERYISEHTSLLFRLGGNFTDRRDFSDVNDHEEGQGFGASFGYRKHFPLTKGEIVAGLHLDSWNLWIDWEDRTGKATNTSGTTYIFVLQPWLEAGYFFPIENSSSRIGITAGFGREINAITNGEEVAEDWIASISLWYQFSLN